MKSKANTIFTVKIQPRVAKKTISLINLWKDSRKNIVFTNKDSKRVRDANLSKTFTLE